jgi:hypothetical protein
MISKRMNKPLIVLALYLAGASMGALAAVYELPLAGPVHKVTSMFEYEDKPLTGTDVVFLGRHESRGVELHFATEVERVAMKELRRWTIEELERSSETVFPADLANVLRRLVELPIRNT